MCTNVQNGTIPNFDEDEMSIRQEEGEEEEKETMEKKKRTSNRSRKE